MKRLPLVLVILVVLVACLIYFVFPDQGYRLSIALERKAEGLVEEQVQADDFMIHYLDGGRGKTILLLHGFGADKDKTAWRGI